MIANNWLKPHKTIYYQWTILLQILHSLSKLWTNIDIEIIFDKYKNLTKDNGVSESYTSFLLVLDWLFILELVQDDGNWNIILSKKNANNIN